jgi:hypothetical protein
MSFYGEPSAAGSEASWEEEEPAQRRNNNDGAPSDYTTQQKEEEEQKSARAAAAAPAATTTTAPPPAAAPAAAAPPPTTTGSLRRRPQHHRPHRLAVSFADLPLPPRPLAAAAAVPPSLHRALAAWRAFRGDAPTEAAQDRAIAHGFAPDATYDGPLLRLRGRAALAVHAYAQRVLLGAAFCVGAFGGVDAFAGGEEGGLAEARVPLAGHGQHQQQQHRQQQQQQQQEDGGPEGGGRSGGSENEQEDDDQLAIAAALRMLPPPPVHIKIVSVDMAPGPLFGDGGEQQEAGPSGGGRGREGDSSNTVVGSAAVTYKASYRLPLKPPPWPLSALFPFSAVSVWATDVLHLRAAGVGEGAAAAASGAPTAAHAEITAVHSRPHNCPTVVPGFVRRVFGATSTWFLGEVLRW